MLIATAIVLDWRNKPSEQDRMAAAIEAFTAAGNQMTPDEVRRSFGEPDEIFRNNPRALCWAYHGPYEVRMCWGAKRRAAWISYSIPRRRPGTELTIEVENAFGEQLYRLTCEPAGGDVPRPAELCDLLADHAEVMLANDGEESTCAGGHFTVHLGVRGSFDGRAVDATDVDACQGNLKAERLWLSQLPLPPGWKQGYGRVRERFSPSP